jgi:hypothetical protein
MAALIAQTDAAMKRYNSKAVQGAEYEEFKLFQKHLQLHKESKDRYEPKAFAVSSGPLEGATDGGPALRYPARSAYRPADVHVLAGGNLQSAGEKVTPGVFRAVQQYGGYAAPAIPDAVEGRRLALARWIAHPANPLTARVMANRVWQWHFGTGLAADSNNFGKMGQKPSHPELLDWLAVTFADSGWSVKSLHRAILLSSAYQRSSRPPAGASEKDPRNHLLSYVAPRRLEAEAFRDALLAVSGELSREAGGPPVFPQINEDAARQPRHAMGSLQPVYRPSPTRAERNRRTIYAFQRRTMPDPMVEVFNGPNPDFSCERREASIVPSQAFALLNGQPVHDLALAMADRLAREFQRPEARIEQIFLRAYGRRPDAEESRMALAHLRRMRAVHHENPMPARSADPPIVHMITSELTGEKFRFVQPVEPGQTEPNLHASQVTADVRALADVVLAVFNSNEFAYIY